MALPPERWPGAGLRQKVRARRNASGHGADLAYSKSVALPAGRGTWGHPPVLDRPTARPQPSTWRGRTLSATLPLPRVGGPLWTARVPRRSSGRFALPASPHRFVSIASLARGKLVLTIRFLMKPRHFEPGASSVACGQAIGLSRSVWAGWTTKAVHASGMSTGFHWAAFPLRLPVRVPAPVKDGSWMRPLSR